MSLWHRFTAVLTSEAREELGAAQFVLGPDAYLDFIWRERVKASKPQRRSHKNGWPLSIYAPQPKPKSNVTPIGVVKREKGK